MVLKLLNQFVVLEYKEDITSKNKQLTLCFWYMSWCESCLSEEQNRTEHGSER